MFFEFLNSPRIAILVLAVLAAEAVILGIIWTKYSKGLGLAQIVSFLGAGACFALCLFGALSSFGGGWIAVTLTGAFIFHLLDLRMRWQS